METLESAVNALIEQKGEIVNDQTPSEIKAEVISALKQKLTTEIIEEIKQKRESEIISEAMNEIKKQKNAQEIKRLKNLLWEGFLIAFIVGLAVNQITDLITYIKDVININTIFLTLILTLILIFIIFVVYLYTFFKNALSSLQNTDSSNIKD